MDSILMLVDDVPFKFDSIQITFEDGIKIPCVRFCGPDGKYHVYAGRNYYLPITAEQAAQMYDLFPGARSHSSRNSEWTDYSNAQIPKEYAIYYHGTIVFFTQVDYIYIDETKVQHGYLIYDIEDVFYDNAVILLDFDEEPLPKNEQELDEFFVHHNSECTPHIRYAGCGLWHVFSR